MEGEMKYCMHCGKEILADALYCPYCGCAVGTYHNKVVEDRNSTALNVLSFFIPLVGLILYLVYKDKTPIKAKGIGKFALIGFVVNLVLLAL